MDKQLWNKYKNSSEGRYFIDLFTDDEMMGIIYSAEICDTFCDENYDDTFTWQMIQNRINKDNFVPNKMNRDEFWKFICEFDLDHYCCVDFDENPILIDGDKYLMADELENKLYHIDSISIFLSTVNSFFKPLLYRKRVDITLRNSKILGIDLPPIPSSDDYKDLFLYYYDICEIWNEFQKKNSLTFEEFCGCLYGFATECYNQQQEDETVLPDPTNYWLIGCDGENNDYEKLEKFCSHKQNDFTCVCNEQIKQGDVILIYVTKPYYFIHFICRAKTDAIYTPFDKFKTRTILCKAKKISPIRFEDINNNECLMRNQAVSIKFKRKKCLQLTDNEYQEFMKILK